MNRLQPFVSLAVIAAALALGTSAWTAEKSLLILHTNDLHDHVRADYDGSGGLAYVGGYIKSVLAEREDVLVLDAGDVMEKGDLVAFKTQSRIMYEAMGKIGYDAAAPGNHDDTYGDDHLSACDALAPRMSVLAVNMLKRDGSLRFPASKIFERGGLRIGVIGVFRPRDALSLNLEETAEAVAREAARLDTEVDLVVVVAHLGTAECAQISAIARDVDVFVSGHTHQALQRPLVLKETGALVVQAGSYAEYVGRLELTVDDESDEIVAYDGKLVPMIHGEVPHDRAMQDWFGEREDAVSPDADKVVTESVEGLAFLDMAYLGAEGIRRMAGAEIGFCHMSQIIRAALPSGSVDANAIFRTGGQRAEDVVESRLSGEVIAAYVAGLANSDWGKTHWSGFRGRYERDGRTNTLVSNLEPERMYRVAMPKKEWDTRFVRFFERHGAALGIDVDFQARGIDVSFTDGVVRLFESAARGLTAKELAESIREGALLSRE